MKEVIAGSIELKTPNLHFFFRILVGLKINGIFLRLQYVLDFMELI